MAVSPRPVLVWGLTVVAGQWRWLHVHPHLHASLACLSVWALWVSFYTFSFVIAARHTAAVYQLTARFLPPSLLQYQTTYASSLAHLLTHTPESS